MDPREALKAILRGHMVADHGEALREWLRNGGWCPMTLVPSGCHPFFKGWSRAHKRPVTTDWRGIHGTYVNGLPAFVTWTQVIESD